MNSGCAIRIRLAKSKVRFCKHGFGLVKSGLLAVAVSVIFCYFISAFESFSWVLPFAWFHFAFGQVSLWQKFSFKRVGPLQLASIVSV